MYTLKPISAWLDDIHRIELVGEDLIPLINQRISPVIIIKERHIPTRIELDHNHNSLLIHFTEELPLGERIYLDLNDRLIPVYPRNIVRTQWFEENFTMPTAELGTRVLDGFCIFQLWAPLALSVSVVIDDKKYALKRTEKGIWRLQLAGDWHEKTYQFEVEINGEFVSVNDPYAKALTANSEKGVLINLQKTYQMNSPNPNTPLSDAIIYELHVRDATVHDYSGVKHKGTFLGLTEYPSQTPNGFSTGLSYLKELGITHVELLPINDFARVNELSPESSYNWGYDPLFYQVPEGSYSSNANDPIARINQCKKMIDTFHAHGLAVILDVVFNHTFIHQHINETVFEKIVPGYYYRFYEDGSISNGTGCGNDIASEKIMVRKFILDTVDYWLSEYKVDGFRFDLMGVIDLETMNAVSKRCKQADSPILLLGEGWELTTALPTENKSTIRNSANLTEIRFFNDMFRDSLKGQLFTQQDKGFVNGNGRYYDRMPFLLSGSCLNEFGYSFVRDVSQVINYVECHDNYTLWDRLALTNKDCDEETRKKMHQLATGMTLLSQGIPFIHAGQEWFRTKYGEENSYNLGDRINQLDWKKREQENENIEFFKALISIRKKYPVFRLLDKNEIKNRIHYLKTPFPVIGFILLGDDESICVYINPTFKNHKLQLPAAGKWELLRSNHQERWRSGINIQGESTTIQALELLIFKKNFIRA